MSPLTDSDPTIVFSPVGSLTDLRRRQVRRDLVHINIAWTITVTTIYLMAYGGWLVLTAPVVYIMWQRVWRQRFPAPYGWVLFGVIYGLFTVGAQQLITSHNPGVGIILLIALFQLYSNWGLARARYAGGD